VFSLLLGSQYVVVEFIDQWLAGGRTPGTRSISSEALNVCETST
jgi:hypothetical protein